ncbi:hypothetical protein UY3_15566 [Chelonia mydas]|uniref:Uncharacterized protein n=1 Tax=Chelonia mydas TaxID=8469 RepID=M7B5E8_CHEMY|nr:hypothetical protein UY3_15566 [Chelonia mydas]
MLEGNTKANKPRAAKIRAIADGALMGKTAKEREWNVMKSKLGLFTTTCHFHFIEKIGAAKKSLSKNEL